MCVDGKNDPHSREAQHGGLEAKPKQRARARDHRQLRAQKK